MFIISFRPVRNSFADKRPLPLSSRASKLTCVGTVRTPKSQRRLASFLAMCTSLIACVCINNIHTHSNTPDMRPDLLDQSRLHHLLGYLLVRHSIVLSVCVNEAVENCDCNLHMCTGTTQQVVQRVLYRVSDSLRVHLRV